ncbi:enolase C-terminal domain-like protein [Chloroflexota bacterium]
MKIKDVRTEVYLQERPPLVFRDDVPPPPSKVLFTIVRVTTDDGIEGFAFGNKAIAEPTVSSIKPEIIGKDPLDREWIWQRLWYRYDHGRSMAFPLEALSAVDIALWDLAGKYFGVPVYKLMGGYRDKIKIFASSWGKQSDQDYVDEAVACKAQGISGYKIHPYRTMAEENIKTCRAVREAVGSDMKLIFDAVGRYTRSEALRVGKELENLNFYFFEEPIPDHDIEGLIKLREKLNIPICALETAPMSLYSVPEYILRRAVDIIRPDAWRDGGITPAKKIADLCDAFGMRAEVHPSIWFPTCNLAILHIACAIKNCEFYDMLWPEWRYGLKEYPKLDDEGYIHVPQKPGLGIDIDWEALGEPVEKF